MDNTANLGLRLPAGNDYADVADFNYNFEQLDAAMAAARAAEEYDGGTAYSVGDYCIRDGKLYKCVAGITTGEVWNAAHWAETNIDAEFKALYAALAGKAAVDHTHTAAQIGADPSGSAAAVQASLNAHTVRTDNPHGVTAGQIGAVSASSVRDIIAQQKWALLATYFTAGAFTFAVPTGYTKLGIYMVGGGGSGGSCYYYNTIAGASTGGASGYGKNVILDVTPGQQFSGIIGAGAAAVNGNSNGLTGGSTSFNGISVLGGSGGKYVLEYSVRNVAGSDGGQGSDACGITTKVDELNRRLFGGVQTESTVHAPSNSWGRVYLGGRSQSPRESQNLFDTSMVTLCAGGWGGYPSSTLCGQTMAPTDLGYKGGNGSGTYDNAPSNAESGVGPGSGGGGKFHGSTTFASCYSGAGAPGGIFIYGIRG
ncbi:glycine-rich domain-containing protein [Oscillibacter sp. GMB15532]|uniref:glycine-rich domain-containing protein n=1 Tax=Oscillibacter sp. GMB15532 TaxID=3230022 RepID=UPI0034DF0056